MFCWRVVWYSFPSNKLEKVKCKTKLNVNNFEMCCAVISKHPIMIGGELNNKKSLYKVSENKDNVIFIFLLIGKTEVIPFSC